MAKSLSVSVEAAPKHRRLYRPISYHRQVITLDNVRNNELY
jgi:hypothetical protein